MSNTESNPEHLFEKLQEFAVERMREIGVPGAAVGILIDGQIYNAGLGETSVEHPLPVTEETLFQIGSITKTFVALLILRLVEEGKLSLDAPVRTYLPEFRVADETAAAGATIRHLLTHSSGWAGDFFRDTGAGDDALPRYLSIMTDLEQTAPLGYTYSYNNAGFYVAGAVIEAVTGQSFQEALRQRVLDPLALHHLYFDPADVMVHRFAVGHNIAEDGEGGERKVTVAKPWPLPRAAYAAGGIATSMPQLLEYARFQMGDGTTAGGERLLTPESMAMLHAPQLSIGGAFDSVALSWFIDRVDGAKCIQHSGGTTGQISLLRVVPERGFAVGVFTNANRGGFLTRDVSNWAVREYLGAEIDEPTPQARPAAELAALEGRYSRPFADLDVRLDGDELTVQVTPKLGFPSQDTPPAPPSPAMPLAFYDTDYLVVTDGPMKHSRAEIVRDPNGEIGWLRLGSRIHRRQE